MGWWGIVFKGDISRVSEHLAIGLTTGYLGSLTTLSGWNQSMLNLSVQGKWAFAVFGLPLGNARCIFTSLTRQSNKYCALARKKKKKQYYFFFVYLSIHLLSFFNFLSCWSPCMNIENGNFYIYIMYG